MPEYVKTRGNRVTKRVTDAERKRAKVGGQRSVHIGAKIRRELNGEEDFSKWTNKELIRGYRGKGRPPSIIPRAVFYELSDRVMSAVRHRFTAELQYAMEVHFEIIADEDVPANVRLRAIEMVYEVMGLKQAPMVVVNNKNGDGNVEEKWKELMATVIVNTEEQAELVETTGVKRNVDQE